MRTLLTSAILTIITSIHALLNKGSKQKKRKGVLYSSYAGNAVLTPIQERLPGTLLLTLNMFHKSSLLQRGVTKDTIRFANIISRPFIGVHLDEKIFRKHLAKFMYDNQKAFLKRNKFTRVIMIDEFSMPNTLLTKAAKEEKILTVAMQHGLIDKDDLRYSKGKKRDSSLLVDYVIVQSEKEKAFLTKESNFSSHSVLALGFPPYDKLAQPKKYFQKASIRRKYNLPQDKKIVLWLTQSHDPDFVKQDENNRNCQGLFPFFKEHEEFLFVIKLHPNENQQAPVYRKWNKKFGNKAIILGKEAETLALIAASDIVMTKHSTSAFEAALLEKPLLRIEFFKNKYGGMYDNTGLTMVVKKQSDVEQVIAQVIDPPYKKALANIKDALVKHRYPHFGHASSTIANTIKNLKI